MIVFVLCSGFVMFIHSYEVVMQDKKNTGHDQIYVEPPVVTYDDDLNELHVYFGSNSSINIDDLKAPVIGDNVEVCCGAKVIGGITVGNNVLIGANAVVVKDVPPNCVVAGVPARVIRQLDHVRDLTE